MFRDTSESVPFSGAVAQDTVGTLKLFEDVPLSLLREGDGLFLAMVHPHVVQLEFLSPVDLRAVVAWLDHDPSVHPVAVLLVVFERGEFCTRRAHGTRVGDSRVPLPLPLVVKLLDDFLSEAGAATDALAAQNLAPGVVVQRGIFLQPHDRLAPVTLAGLVWVVGHPVMYKVIHTLEGFDVLTPVAEPGPVYRVGVGVTQLVLGQLMLVLEGPLAARARVSTPLSLDILGKVEKVFVVETEPSLVKVHASLLTPPRPLLRVSLALRLRGEVEVFKVCFSTTTSRVDVFLDIIHHCPGVWVFIFDVVNKQVGIPGTLSSPSSFRPFLDERSVLKVLFQRQVS